MSLVHLAISEASMSDGALADAVARLAARLGDRGWYLVRERELPARALVARVGAVVAAAGAGRVIVSDRVDVARTLGVAVQLPEAGLTVAEARAIGGPALRIGASRHEAAGAAQAAREGADWVTVGPVFATPSKPGIAGMGTDALAAAVEAVRHAGTAVWMPGPAGVAVASRTLVLALGGVCAANVARVRAVGVDGVAAIRAAWTAELV